MNETGRATVTAVSVARPPLNPDAADAELLADIAVSLRLVLDHLDGAEKTSRGVIELLGVVSRSKRFRMMVGPTGGN